MTEMIINGGGFRYMMYGVLGALLTASVIAMVNLTRQVAVLQEQVSELQRTDGAIERTLERLADDRLK